MKPLYEFLRNDVFDARNPFAFDGNGVPFKNPLRRNQLGDVEPSRLPENHLRAGRRLSQREPDIFFFSTKGSESGAARMAASRCLRSRSAADFTGQPTIFNPFNVVNNARVAPNSRIPDALISPISRSARPHPAAERQRAGRHQLHSAVKQPDRQQPVSHSRRPLADAERPDHGALMADRVGAAQPHDQLQRRRHRDQHQGRSHRLRKSSRAARSTIFASARSVTNLTFCPRVSASTA